jgi:hypothetical protein
MTQTPALTNPKSGIRNQKKGSCEPSRASFVVKSNTDVVLFPCQLRKPTEAARDSSGEFAMERARKDIARSNTGRDERRQRSKASAKVMKTPARQLVICRLCIVEPLTCFIMLHELLPKN